MVKAVGLQTSAMLSYSIGLYSYADNAYIDIYRGRCYTDSDGSVELHIDGVLRDYAYRRTRTWEQYQQIYLPAELEDMTDPLHCIENGRQFLVSEVLVTIYDDEDNAVWQSTSQSIWAGFVAPWQDGDLSYVSHLASPLHIDLSQIGTNAVAHFPPVKTTRLWLGMSLVWIDDDVDSHPEIGVDLSRWTIPFTGAGCYAFAYTLHSLYSVIANEQVIDGEYAASEGESTIDGGDADDVADTDVDGGGAAQMEYTIGGTDIKLYYNGTSHVVAHVDNCASPYYVAWTLPSGGWMCRGFDGNTIVGGTPQADIITDLMDADRVVELRDQNVYALTSGFLTRDEYNLLCTLRYAREVYLYDTKRDRGVWCTVDNRSLPTAGNVRWRNQPFTLSLKEITHMTI